MNYGRYNIVSELGKGSMGMVYQAHDPQIDRMVALKVLREDRLTTEDYVQRFLKEATAIGRLSHPGIVTVFDVGQDQGTIYIAMEFLEGQSLDRLLQANSLNLQQIIDLGIEAANGLQYAHQRGIVHRDIKPQNIIYSPEGTIKITDFGIAHIDDTDGQQMTKAGEILGTPAYMAPEQVMGQPVDGRADLYSLGVILYELTTGRRPFQGENLAAMFRAITSDAPVAPKQINPEIPDSLSAIILKAINKNPEDRFATGQEFAATLQNATTENSNFTETVIQTAPVKQRSAKPFIFTILLLISVCAAAGLFYFKPWVTKQKETPSPKPQASSPTQENTTPVEVPPQEEHNISPISITPEVHKIINKPSNIPDSREEEKEATQQAKDSIDALFSDGNSVENDTQQEIPPQEIAPITVPDKQSQEQKAVIQPDNKPLPPQQESVEKMATLAINSNPAGANVYIDGNFKGITPAAIEISAEKHEVKLELQGHLGWQAQLNLSKGGKIPISIPLPAE